MFLIQGPGLHKLFSCFLEYSQQLLWVLDLLRLLIAAVGSIPPLGSESMNPGRCMACCPNLYARGTEQGRGPVFGQLSAKEQVVFMLS